MKILQSLDTLSKYIHQLTDVAHWWQADKGRVKLCSLSCTALNGVGVWGGVCVCVHQTTSEIILSS